MKKHNRVFPGVACALTVAACNPVGPDFRSPELMQPSRFVFAPDHALQQAAEHNWWRDLEDPVLDDLIDRALAQNLDLETARARIKESRALLGTVGLQAKLSDDASVSASYSRGETGGWAETRNLEYQPSFLVNLFGGAQREQEAAWARVAAAEFARSAVRLGLILEVMNEYTELRQREAELEVRKRALVAQSGIVDILAKRLTVGEAHTVELRRAQAELASAKAFLPSLEAERDIRALRLATLLAEPVGGIVTHIKNRKARQPVPDENIDPGIPAALLKNRPDVRSAEAIYAAALAEIGVAEAQLYPSLRVSGTIRITSDSRVGVGSGLSIPVLGRGVLEAQTVAARARAEQALIAWRQAVLSASEEVQVALVQLQQADRQLNLLQDSVQAHSEAVRLSRQAFELGSLSSSEILEAELNSSSARISLTSAKRAYALAWAQLNVAIGMGWHPPERAYHDLKQGGAVQQGGGRSL